MATKKLMVAPGQVVRVAGQRRFEGEIVEIQDQDVKRLLADGYAVEPPKAKAAKDAPPAGDTSQK